MKWFLAYQRVISLLSSPAKSWMTLKREKAGWCGHGDPGHDNARQTRFQNRDTHSRETQEDTLDLPRQPVLPVDPEHQQRKRVQWVKDNLLNSFDDVVWTDEFTIQLENNWTFSYRKAGSPPKRKLRAKHLLKVMVWAGISNNGATNICLLGCSVNSAVYLGVMRTHLLPFLCEWLPIGTFQQNKPLATPLKQHRGFSKQTRLKCWWPYPRAWIYILSKVYGTWWSISFEQRPNPVTKRNSCKAYSHSGPLWHQKSAVDRPFENGHAQSYRSLLSQLLEMVARSWCLLCKHW